MQCVGERLAAVFVAYEPGGALQWETGLEGHEQTQYTQTQNFLTKQIKTCSGTYFIKSQIEHIFANLGGRIFSQMA